MTSSRPPAPEAGPRATPAGRRPVDLDRVLAVLGVLGVAGYVLTWLVLGIVRAGYDPAQQAISELFALDAPTGHRVALSAALVVTGVLLVPFAAMLHRRVPGTSLLGPVLLGWSGLTTALVVLWPCTAGCPGFGTTTTDTMHVLVAGSGYVGLVTAPLAFAHRLREHWPRLALASAILGGAAFLGFVVRNLGVDAYGGLQQRVFNTLADVWIALMGIAVLRRMPAAGPADGRRRPGA